MKQVDNQLIDSVDLTGVLPAVDESFNPEFDVNIRLIGVFDVLLDKFDRLLDTVLEIENLYSGHRDSDLKE